MGLLAGAAKIDITPQGPVHLCGAVGAYRPAQRVLEPLFARALVLRDETQTLCLLVLDVTIVTAEYSGPLRQAAAELLGCPLANVLVCATQTHSAPSLGYFMLDQEFATLPPELEWLRGAEADWADRAAELALEAVGRALADLEPVEVGAASGVEGRLAFNRRAVGRDGRVGMPGRSWDNPLGPTWIRYLEGPMDPEVGVVCFRTADLRLKAMLVHYTCHPVHVFPKQVVSPDWPGALCAELEGRHLGCVPLVLNGACGNINPWPPFEPDYADDHCLMGRGLAEVVDRVLGTLSFAAAPPLRAASRTLQLPFRELAEEELADAERVLAAAPIPPYTDEARTAVDPAWVAAASVYSVHLQARREGRLAYEVQAFRVGGAALVALPGEPFVEGQLEIKLASPVYPTYLAHCATQYVGYIPTARALQRGGHEVNTRYWAKLRPDALETIVEGAVAALRSLGD